MKYDIFFSLAQTPAQGHLPTESEMFDHFFEQVEAADALGYGVAWVAETHLSSEVQKTHRAPVIPHWEGEIGLNVDILQLAHHIFRRTRRIECGSAVMNILCMGGPIAAAERVSYFLTLHGHDPAERRRLHVGFAAGRFDFMNRASGIVPRDAVELAAGPALKNAIFDEAAEIFCRLLRGDTLSSDDIAPRQLTRADFRGDAAWARVQAAATTSDDAVPLARRFEFEPLRIVPATPRRELLQLVVGSHDPRIQEAVNRILPVQVFNLSITRPEVIEATHERMARAYHPAGGPWRREFMPRTVFVFLNEEPGLSPAQRSERARAEATDALGAYWKALEGTIDPQKVAAAADNALVGNAEEVAAQALERFHPDDRLMLWFDFFQHDSARVVRNMTAFMERVRPLIDAGVAASAR
ncbi:MAG: LLM class flavin-dependent oxidoreductase [Deltaproteobacteria bacterium]|nr:LLM class flavin-dependent oxidoreductase [Deltaproteobacteria bacterium]MCB9788811.1 LLM class flavin-dependent oxidoreductase [Deltaproteobacteria bacterium]